MSKDECRFTPMINDISLRGKKSRSKIETIASSKSLQNIQASSSQ